MLVPTNEESTTDYYMSLEPEGEFFGFVYEADYERNKELFRKKDEREASPASEPCANEADHAAREAAAVLAAAREAASREEAIRVAAEKRKRKIDEVSDEVVKKLKNVLKDELKSALQSPDFMGQLADTILARMPAFAPRAAAGERQQNAGEEDQRDDAAEQSAGGARIGDHQSVSPNIFTSSWLSTVWAMGTILHKIVPIASLE